MYDQTEYSDVKQIKHEWDRDPGVTRLHSESVKSIHWHRQELNPIWISGFLHQKRIWEPNYNHRQRWDTTNSFISFALSPNCQLQDETEFKPLLSSQRFAPRRDDLPCQVVFALLYRIWTGKSEMYQQDVSRDDWRCPLIEIHWFLKSETTKIELCWSNSNLSGMSWPCHRLCHPLRTPHRHGHLRPQGRVPWWEPGCKQDPLSSVALHQWGRLRAHQTHHQSRLPISSWSWRELR